MTNLNDVDDLHDLTAPYVLDALDHDEREIFEAHLSGCSRCTTEVAELSETLADLGAAYEQEAPVALRSSILDAIAEVPQERAEPTTTMPTTTQPTTPPAGKVTETIVAASSAPRHAEVVSLSDFRSRRASRVLALAVAAAMVVALALGGWVIRLNSQLNQQQVSSAQAQSDAQLLAAPDASFFSVRMQDGSSGSYVVSKDLNRAVFYADGPADLGSERIYQLWTQQGPATYISAGTFTGSGRQRVALSGDIDSASLLAITVEPNNGGRGSASPTTDPFAPAQLD